MGKGTDKLYITHSEWASEDAYSASAGAGVARSQSGSDVPFRRLPFNYCALSLLPFQTPYCTQDGTIFDYEHILRWLEKHGTNPVDSKPLKKADLVKLNFLKNDDGEFVDPVTYKVFTDNTHIVALRNTGNVFAWDTVERLNIKAKSWKDLVSDEDFTRKDIITLQDPQNVESRNLSSFKHINSKAGANVEDGKNGHGSGPGGAARGNSDDAKILKAKEAVARARAEREKSGNPNKSTVSVQKSHEAATGKASSNGTDRTTSKVSPYNAAQYTSGKAAASFTSTGLTPHTSGERALLSEEEYMLKPKRVKITGYARLRTNRGELDLELYPEHAPKAVWNFVQLAKKGYYKNTIFHRNIRNFMIQGGDPTGTGKGGNSIWGKTFADEFDGPNTHDSRGVLSMANKGKNTNSSQFFITYRATKHLDRKHTIFGKVVGSADTMSRLENAETNDKDKPLEDIVLEDVAVYVDPFEEFLKQRSEKEEKERQKAEIMRQGGAEDDRITWTGKRIRADGTVEQESTTSGIGKYLKAATQAAVTAAATAAVIAAIAGAEEDEIVEEWDEPVDAPPRKKARAGGGTGFGNFDSW